MKKVFTFLFAALMSVSMFGRTVQQDITLDANGWWGWDSSKENVDGKLVGTITGGYGAIATSNVGEADWSEWTKLVVVVDNIEGCDGQWWYLKAELRNPGYVYPGSVTMTGELGKQGHNPSETNYVVIDLTTVPEGFDITQIDALVLQSELPGTFTVSRIFLEKEEEDVWEYFLVGSINGWNAVDLTEDLKLTANPGAEGEYMIEYTFAADDQFKVVGRLVGEQNVTWFPDGMDNNYLISEAGNYTVYFRPDGQGGQDWHYGYIYAARSTEGIENIKLTKKAQKVIVDGMLYIVRDGKMFNATGAEVK
jgi:hypothetical protein